MIIAALSGGLGNQFYIYACGKYLAHKLNTELKLDISNYMGMTRLNSRHTHNFYELCDFNIEENFATAEEVKHVRETGLKMSYAWQGFENFQGDIIVPGYIGGENYFIEIIDVLRKEFTLKKPFSPAAESLRQKILAAECSVSMHFRYSDYAYIQGLDNGTRPWFNVTPLSYCYTCVEILKQIYGKFTLFVFSDNLQYIKKSLRLDIPTEFVEGCESAPEELILMSLCQNNITPGSSFSKSAAMLNPNPNKRVFHPHYTTAEEAQKYIQQLRTEHLILTNNQKSPFADFGKMITVPCNFREHTEFDIRPMFSVILVVNNDSATIAATLDSIFKQDYKYYELIIIDNASTDGSNKICKDAVAGKENVIFKKLYSKVTNANARNMALDMAQGQCVSFITREIISNALTGWYSKISWLMVDIVISFEWLEEDDNGNVNFAGKKYAVRRNAGFKNQMIKNAYGRDDAKFLMNKQLNGFMSTKIYNREFLLDNGIRFDESLDDDKAELLFQTEAFFKSKYFVYTAHACCVAPTKKGK